MVDSLDPLNTSDPVAPHSTTLSSFNYLMKEQTLSFTKGEVLKCLNQIPDLEEDKAWWVGLGRNLLPQNYAPFVPTVMVHINGYKLAFKQDGEVKVAGLIEDETKVVLARLFAVDKLIVEQQKGTKIGELQGIGIYALILDTNENLDLSEEYQALVASFPYPQALLAYYWYIETGVYHGSVERELYDEEPGRLLESLNIQKK
ncbi:unnamed protein product [Blepharisma stoltei]|uniref:Uncharacterized protein n=1 Tax=Blepharisma stoltei TaxID=1481888 RepID=A0AAU9IAR3_9CILI|nr:unnamed protein product [Blepharisma stoltei]